MFYRFMLGAAAAITLSASAHAALVGYKVDGTVTQIFYPATTEGVRLGDTITLKVRFESDALTDITAITNARFGTHYTDLRAAPLDQPGSALLIRVGPNTLTLADHTDAVFGDLGLGIAQPFAMLVNGAFHGVFYFGLHGTGGVSTAGPIPFPLDFGGGSFYGAPGPSYGGVFNYAGATLIDSVPEPNSWAMLIACFGLIGAVMLRRQRSDTAAAD